VQGAPDPGRSSRPFPGPAFEVGSIGPDSAVTDRDPSPDEEAPRRSPWGFAVMVALMILIVGATAWEIIRY